jgi:hypothetical protein
MRNSGFIPHMLVAMAAITMVGCAKMPRQTGTWIGLVTRATYVTLNGQPRDVLVLNVEEGSRMGDSGFEGLRIHEFERQRIFSPTGVLVTAEGVALNYYAIEGKRISVSGVMQPAGAVVDPFDGAGIVRPGKEVVNQLEGLLMHIRTEAKKIKLISPPEMRE